MVTNFNKITGIVLTLNRIDLWAILVTLLLLSTFIPLLILTKETQSITGDEPYYLFYAINFWKQHNPTLSHLDYNSVLVHLGKISNGLPSYNMVVASKPTHNIIYPAIIATAVGQIGVFGGRLVSLFVGLSGLAGLFLLLYQISRIKLQAFCFTLLIAITFPILPYLSLALPEIVLFSGTAWILYLFRNSTTKSSILIALLLIFLSFIHWQALGLILGTPILFLARQIDEYDYQLSWHNWRNSVIFMTILMISLTLFVVFNLSIYGNLFGAINIVRPIFSDLGIASALIGARHGLLTYAPIWMMGISGLILGCLHNNIWAIRSSVLLGFLIIGFIGPDAGECWPARFWVIAIPTLTVGLLLAWQYSSCIGRILFIILILVSLLNTLTYTMYPNMYLENRQISRVYDYWHEIMPVFHFGIPLIVAGQPWHGKALLLLILIGLAIQSISKKNPYKRWVFGILFLLGFLGTSIVKSVDIKIYDKESNHVNIQFKNDLIANGVFLLKFYYPWWFFLPQTSMHANGTLIPLAPSLLLDLYGRPELNLILSSEFNNLRQSPIILLRTCAPWVRWLSISNQVWSP